MEALKWFGSTVISLIVVSAGISAAFAVASFMLVVQLWGLVAMIVAGVAIMIKESLFGSKDE